MFLSLTFRKARPKSTNMLEDKLIEQKLKKYRNFCVAKNHSSFFTRKTALNYEHWFQSYDATDKYTGRPIHTGLKRITPRFSRGSKRRLRQEVS